MASFIWITPMSLLFSVVGFCVQLCVIASLGAIIISSVCPPSADSALIGEDHPSGAVVPVDDGGSDASLSSARACAKPIISASYTVVIDEPVRLADDLDTLTIRQLKALCKSRSVKGYSYLRKHELVELLSTL